MRGDRSLARSGLTRVARRLAGVSVVAVAVIVGSTGTAGAVENGRTVTGGAPWMVKLRGHADCTGTLIARGWVLTARHCVVARDGSPMRPRHEEVWIGRYRLLKPMRALAVKRIMPASRVPYGRHLAPDDIALVELEDKSIGRAPLPLLPQASLGASEPTALFGYGCSGEKAWVPLPGIGCVASFVLKATPLGAFENQPNCVRGKVCFRQSGTGTQRVWYGDSGAPWMHRMGGDWVQAAVESSGTSPRPQVNYATPVVPWLTWLRRTTGLPTPVAGTIWRAPHRAYLIEADGFRRDIATAAVLGCLIAAGHAIVALDAFTVQTAPLRHDRPAACSEAPGALPLPTGGWVPFGTATLTPTDGTSFRLGYDGTFWGGAVYPVPACDYTFSAQARVLRGDGYGLAVRAAIAAGGAPRSGPAFQYDLGLDGYRFTEYPTSEGGVTVRATVDHDWHAVRLAVHGTSYVASLDGRTVRTGVTAAPCQDFVLLRVWRTVAEFRDLVISG